MTSRFDTITFVMAKGPIKGWCKTKLMPKIGAERAALFEEALLKDTLNLVRPLSSFVHLCLGIPEGKKWSVLQPSPYHADKVVLTEETDVGKIIASTAASQWEKRYHGAIFIGTDTPHSHAELFGSATEALKENDLVLGPTEDGGVFLIGVRRDHPDLWRDVTWGSPEVFEQLRENAESLDLSVATLPTQMDIDSYEDLKTFKTIAFRNSERLPSCVSLLGRWDLI